MKNRFILSCLLLCTVLLSGCATPTRMAFEKDDDKVTQSSPPVYLMTVTLKNIYRPTWQPKLLVVHTEKRGAKEAADRLNFTMDDKAKEETDKPDTGNTYILRIPLKPGQYDIVGLTSLSRSFPISGFFFTPLHASLEVKESGVYYLGHVSATVRERKGTEFKAGPSIPLIDQAVIGASGGSFDVEIIDRLSADEAMFRNKFPALKGVNIVKQILPPFDRAVAQKWWEAN